MADREKGYYWVRDKKGNWEIYYDNGDGYWSGAEWEYIIPEKDIGEIGPRINSPEPPVEGLECCCKEHDLTHVDEQGDEPKSQIPDWHGTIYAPAGEGHERRPSDGTPWPRERACPSCPIHGIHRIYLQGTGEKL